MLRRARVPTPAAERPRPGPLPKAKEAGAPRLFRVATDAVLYGVLATVWVKDFVGTVVEILGRWVFGKGSTVEAAGLAVRAYCVFILVLLSPCYFPLVIMRVREHARLALKEEEREKLLVGSENGQIPKEDRAVPRLPKGVKVAPLYGLLPIVTFQLLAFMMQLHHEEGSIMWRLADVFYDVARLGLAVIVGVWAVRNAVILVTLPKAKDEHD